MVSLDIFNDIWATGDFNTFHKVRLRVKYIYI